MPVRTDGAPMPTERQVTESLHAPVGTNAPLLRHETYRADVDALLTFKHMFDIGATAAQRAQLTQPMLDAAVVNGFREGLTRAVDGLDELSVAQRVDVLRALEELKCAAAGVQAVVMSMARRP